MTTSRRRPPHAPEEGDAAPAPASRRRHARPAARKAPIVPIAVGAGVVVLVVGIALFLMKGSGTKSEATPPHSGPDSVATPSGTSGGAGSTPPAGAASVEQAPTAPKLDAATVTARLTEARSADDAIALGDQVLADTRDGALADACYQKALELEPGSSAAKRKLDVRPIDPQADFPGLEEIHGTAQTYMLREYLLLRGKEMSRAAREKEIARWNAHRKTVEARIAEAADDPFLDKIDRTRNTILNTPYFDQFQYDVIESTRPYALFVELKGESVTDRDQRRQDVEDAYTPFLAAYDRTIHNYLVKLAPKPLTSDPPFIIFILLDRASYDRFFLEFERHPGSPGMRAHYNWREKWAFTYSPEVKNRTDADFGEGTQSLLHEITHAWVDRVARDDTGAIVGSNVVQTHWFSEGIAEFMSCHFLDDGAVRFQPWRSMRLAEVGRRPPGMRIPLKTAFKIGDSGGLDAEANRVAHDQKGMEPGRVSNICMSGFYADMSLFIFWLNYGNDGKYKRAFEDYVRKELSGRGGPEVAERIFADVFKLENLEQIIDDFQKAVSSKKVTFADKDLAPEQ